MKIILFQSENIDFAQQTLLSQEQYSEVLGTIFAIKFICHLKGIKLKREEEQKEKRKFSETFYIKFLYDFFPIFSVTTCKTFKVMGVL